MVWSNETPSTPGFYWCRRGNYTCLVKVWKYRIDSDNRLFTDEDGGAPVTDYELYGDAKWAGPIDIPEPPSNK